MVGVTQVLGHAGGLVVPNGHRAEFVRLGVIGIRRQRDRNDSEKAVNSNSGTHANPDL
jgi:flagellar basal body rod protein FlgF